MGGIISFIAILNTIMVSCSNRFIAISIGKNDLYEVRKTFNVNLIIHFSIAVFTILFALPLGYAYINHYVNYDGDINVAHLIYMISVVASALSFLSVPYNGLLIARERFWVFCSTDVLSSVVKLVLTYILIDNFESKLIIYTIMMAVLTAYPVIVFFIYCRVHFPEITRFLLVKEKKMYLAVLNFAIGIAFGAVATIAKNQGTALIINAFFSTVMNSAFAIANSVNNIILTFAYNIQKSISPQIMKNYAVGNTERYTYLVCLSSRVTFFTMFLLSTPFILIPDTIFGLWLTETPTETITFTQLLIIDILIISINAGIPDIIFAIGKIKIYQAVTNSLYIISIIVGYIALTKGMPIYWLFYSYIIFSIIIFIIRPIILMNLINFDLQRLIKESYTPAFYCVLLFTPMLSLRNTINPWLFIIFATVYLCIIIWGVGLTGHERMRATKRIIKLIKH